MAIAAKAFMIEIEGAGEFINPADSAVWVDLHFRALLVGVDHRIRQQSLTAQIDPTLTGAGMNAVIANAIAAWATGLGYSLAVNQTFLLAFARV